MLSIKMESLLMDIGYTIIVKPEEVRDYLKEFYCIHGWAMDYLYDMPGISKSGVCRALHAMVEVLK